MRKIASGVKLKVRSDATPGGQVADSIVIHVLRPYANEEEYLAREHFSIDSKSMLLIDQPALPAETPIVFDIQLANGQKPIRAEAKVMEHVAASGDKPGGLRVRFKRFGAATKSFIDRAVALGSGSGRTQRPASIRPAPSLVPSPVAGALAEASMLGEPEHRESSGIHRRPVVLVPAPVNREELLERLRTRARSAPRPSDTSSSEQTG